MNLEQRYLNADPATTAGKVRTLQEETVGANTGVNFLDGDGVAPKAVPPNTYQTEFKRNVAGAFRYSAAGQNGQRPGTDTTEDIESTGPNKGLTRWTTTALKKAFLGGNSSLLTKYRTFKGKNYHDYSPLIGQDFTTRLPDLTKAKVIGSPSGPAPSGLAG